VQEFGTDAVVETDTARNVLNIGANLLAQISDFVDETDLGRQKRIGGWLRLSGR
jgi:hypothetical protein